MGGADPDGGVAADPEGEDGGVVSLCEGFEVDPWFVVGQGEGVADDGVWEWTWWLDGVDLYQLAVSLSLD